MKSWWIWWERWSFELFGGSSFSICHYFAFHSWPRKKVIEYILFLVLKIGEIGWSWMDQSGAKTSRMEAYHLYLVARRYYSSPRKHAMPGFHWYSPWTAIWVRYVALSCYLKCKLLIFFLIFELNLVYLTSLVTMGQCGLELFTCYLDSVGVFFPAYLFETASLLVPPVHFLGFWEQCFQNYLLTGVFIPTRWVRPAVVCTFYFAYTTIIASSCAVGWDTQFFMLTPLDDVVL